MSFQYMIVTALYFQDVKMIRGWNRYMLCRQSYATVLLGQHPLGRQANQ